ncbi:MAG: efflux RND transporter periplasmic adaptor subunit [Gammaproteobacteria bacterium]|nr:efflux RND transporter periplasmic adaptor subunit [Gammaproteobacteria bacterium]MBQ0840960.1 efflux RND transporter periplasmic adaptor subunit [Gammaproteobacteria bacterium]
MNRKIAIFIALIVVAGLGSGYWWNLAHRASTPTNSLVLYGNVDIREVRLAFNGSEHVSEILVDEGDLVQAGQLLARLHTERLQAAWDRVNAEAAAAQAEAHAALLSFQRARTMADRKLASREQADELEGTSLAAAAQVAAAKAALVEADEALKDAGLFAPASGVIRDRILEPGDFATPQTPVLTLALMNPVWVRTYLPESYLGKVKPGAAASISSDSFPGKSYPGWVGYISPTAEFTPKNVETPELRTRLVYQVRVYACNPQRELRLGMPATVAIDLTLADLKADSANAAQKTCGGTGPNPGAKPATEKK